MTFFVTLSVFFVSGFAALLWPTFFIDASLPLLVRGVTDRVDRAAGTVGALYGFKTLGAAVRIGPEFDRTTLIDVNTDLFPKDEHDLTRP